jgi:arginine-tRNA-protein transferase
MRGIYLAPTRGASPPARSLRYPAAVQYRVLWDQMEPCPYRDGQQARLPLRLPVGPLSAEQFDECLAAGDRRSGRMLYRTRCPACSSCEPLRVPIAAFVPSKSQRRAWKRNISEVTVRMGPPRTDEARLTMFNRHKLERGLSASGEPLTELAYRSWLVDTCVDTREFSYWLGDRLIAISVVDCGAQSVSSVYHYFDPDESWRSMGVFSALAELAWAGESGFVWYYLGFYVSDCAHLRYKADYLPHERRVAGIWTRFS